MFCQLEQRQPAAQSHPTGAFADVPAAATTAAAAAGTSCSLLQQTPQAGGQARWRRLAVGSHAEGCQHEWAICQGHCAGAIHQSQGRCGQVEAVVWRQQESHLQAKAEFSSSGDGAHAWWGGRDCQLYLLCCSEKWSASPYIQQLAAGS
jgi:hypothetical protein